MNFYFYSMTGLYDGCNVHKENIEVHPNFPLALKTNLNWTKHCNVERYSMADNLGVC